MPQKRQEIVLGKPNLTDCSTSTCLHYMSSGYVTVKFSKFSKFMYLFSAQSMIFFWKKIFLKPDRTWAKFYTACCHLHLVSHIFPSEPIAQNHELILEAKLQMSISPLIFRVTRLDCSPLYLYLLGIGANETKTSTGVWEKTLHLCGSIERGLFTVTILFFRRSHFRKPSAMKQCYCCLPFYSVTEPLEHY